MFKLDSDTGEITECSPYAALFDGGENYFFLTQSDAEMAAEWLALKNA